MEARKFASVVPSGGKHQLIKSAVSVDCMNAKGWIAAVQVSLVLSFFSIVIVLLFGQIRSLWSLDLMHRMLSCTDIIPTRFDQANML